MSEIPADKKAVELSRLLDDLDRAAEGGARAFDQVFNAPPSGLSVHEISPDKRFTRVSQAHRVILGYSPQDLLGRYASDFVILKDTSERAITRKMSPGAVLLPFNRSWRKADGTEITLLMLDRHIKDSENRVIGIRTAITGASKAKV